MTDRPDAHDLLVTARASLMHKLLPALPAALRYEALMLANALAIATREIEHGPGARAEESAALAALLGPGSSTQPLDRMRETLCRRIRQGRFDGEAESAALHAALRRGVQARLQVGNPRLVDGAGR